MPDAHVGYGLPIGGVLAVTNAVIPFAVGMDIACRMKMTVLDLPVSALASGRERLAKALETETRFGVGARVPETAPTRGDGRKLGRFSVDGTAQGQGVGAIGDQWQRQPFRRVRGVHVGPGRSRPGGGGVPGVVKP